MAEENIKDQEAEALEGELLTDEVVDENTTENDAAGTEETADSEDWFSKIDALKEEKSQADDKLIRSHAEIQNLRKRHQKELENAHKYSVEKFATELLAVIDSLEMGLVAANQDEVDIDKIKEGSELTLKMFTTMFDKFDIEVVNPEGEKFDADLHQAISMQPTEGVEPNTVVGVMQKGYKIADRLLRPAMVMVSK